MNSNGHSRQAPVVTRIYTLYKNAIGGPVISRVYPNGSHMPISIWILLKFHTPWIFPPLERGPVSLHPVSRPTDRGRTRIRSPS